MSTTLEITCDGKTTTQRIDHSICRIGSAPNLELCVAGVADHAATLRVQGGKRSLYNRSATPLSLGGKHVQPNQTMPWNDGQVLQLCDGVRFRLLNDKPRAISVVTNGSSTQTATSVINSNVETVAASEKKRSRLTIVGFLLVFATILFSSNSDTTNQARDKEFAQIVEALLASEGNPNAGCYRQIRVDLQNAILCKDRDQSIVIGHGIKQILASKRMIVDPNLDAQIETFLLTHLAV